MAGLLFIDDEEGVRRSLGRALKNEPYTVYTAEDGQAGIQLFQANLSKISIVISDYKMPGPDGLQICRKIGGRNGVPVLLLTARSSDIDKIAGLRLGADDYITKPFNPDELVARVDAVLRRARANHEVRSKQLQLGHLLIDLDRREANVRGRAITLTPKEFDLLATFAHFPNVVLDRDRLLDLAWGTSFYAFRTVDVHVARLREKLKGSGVRIETVWGTGYRLEAEV